MRCTPLRGAHAGRGTHSVAPQDIAFVLPVGADDLTVRPLTMSDAEAVTALARADELEVLAEPMTERVDVLGEWRRPSVDLERDSVSV